MSRNNHEHIDYEHDLFAELCPCRSLLDLLGNKWSTLTIGALDEGPQRFGELQHKLAGISPKVLTQTLRRLENSGFVDRTVFPEVPLHVEYSLTELGHSANVPSPTCVTGPSTTSPACPTSARPVHRRRKRPALRPPAAHHTPQAFAADAGYVAGQQGDRERAGPVTAMGDLLPATTRSWSWPPVIWPGT